MPILIPSLLAQRDDRWEAIVVHDGQSDAWDHWTEFFADPRIRFRSTRDRGNLWGHDIREMVIEQEELHGRYVHLSNCDNYLVPTAVGKINQQTSDVVAWGQIHNYIDYNVLHPRLQLGAIDLASVAVRTDLVKSIGFKWRDNEADWLWLQEVQRRTSDWKFLDCCLGAHN